MRLILPKEYNKFFYPVFPIILILVTTYNIFYDWKLQLYHFNILEDFGSLLLVLVVSFFQSALYTFGLWVFIILLKKVKEMMKLNRSKI